MNNEEENNKDKSQEGLDDFELFMLKNTDELKS